MYLHQTLTSCVIGCAFRVHNKLRPGYLEHVYRNALALELAREGVRSRCEVPLAVHYDGVPVGNCFADLVVEDVVIVETKAVESILPGHLLQLHAYLRCCGLEAGLVVNFGPARVDVRRVAATRKDGDAAAGNMAG